MRVAAARWWCCCAALESGQDRFAGRRRWRRGLDRDTNAQDIAGPHGRRPAQLVDTWRNDRRDVRQVALDQHPHHARRRVPAAGDQPAERPAPGEGGVGVHRLRIVAGRKLDDLRFGHRDVAVNADRSGHVVLEIAIRDRGREVGFAHRAYSTRWDKAGSCSRTSAMRAGSMTIPGPSSRSATIRPQGSISAEWP